jgi:hypothetical protein
MQRSPVIVASFLSLVLLLGLLACGTQAKSGIRGEAIFSARPTVNTISPRTGPDPEALVVVHVGSSAGKVVAKLRPDASGAFAVDLAPGAYTLVQWGPGSVPASISVINAPSRPVVRAVTVVPGKYSRVKLVVPVA